MKEMEKEMDKKNLKKIQEETMMQSACVGVQRQAQVSAYAPELGTIDDLFVNTRIPLGGCKKLITEENPRILPFFLS